MNNEHEHENIDGSAVKTEIAEDAIDLEAYRLRKDEETVSLEEVLSGLTDRGNSEC